MAKSVINFDDAPKANPQKKRVEEKRIGLIRSSKKKALRQFNVLIRADVFNEFQKSIIEINNSITNRRLAKNHVIEILLLEFIKDTDKFLEILKNY